LAAPAQQRSRFVQETDGELSRSASRSIVFSKSYQWLPKVNNSHGGHSNFGGVNHCRPHCRLARFRALMCKGKYSAVIGWKLAVLYGSSLSLQVMRLFQPITGLYFPLYIKTRNFIKRQCGRQWFPIPSSIPSLNPLYHCCYFGFQYLNPKP